MKTFNKVWLADRPAPTLINATQLSVTCSYSLDVFYQLSQLEIVVTKLRPCPLLACGQSVHVAVSDPWQLNYFELYLGLLGLDDYRQT